MQNSKEKNLDFIEILSKEPDNILSLDVSSVKTLQIGYQAETLLLHKADDDTLTIKEYINGLSGLSLIHIFFPASLRSFYLPYTQQHQYYVLR